MSRRWNLLVAPPIVAVAMVTAAMALDEPPVAQKKAAPAAAKKAVPVEKKEMPAAPVAKQVVLANKEAEVFQYINQYRPILRAEYHLLVATCHPDAGQRQQIAREGEKALRATARKNQKMFHLVLPLRQRLDLEPRHQIREALLQSVKARLSDEMVARYQAELERAEARLKRVVIHNLVARLDRELVLNADQRAKIEATITEHHDNPWFRSLLNIRNDGQELQVFRHQMPFIPDEMVVPNLNDEQKDIWSGFQKFTNMVWATNMIAGWMGGGAVVDDPLEDPELKVARLEASKDDPKPALNQPAGVRILHDFRIEVKKSAKEPAKETEKGARTKPAEPKASRKSP